MLEVRRIGKEDLPAVAGLEEKIFSDAWSLRSLEESWSQDGRAVLFGAWSDGHLVGYVIFYYVLDEGEIARIAVDASSRRQGVAGHLLLKLEEFCEEMGISRLMLEVRESNAAAIACYQAYGFAEDGIRRGYYTEPDEDAVLMSRGLGR